MKHMVQHLNLLSREDQAKVIESRWVIGPRSGVLKARFVGKDFTQVVDKEAKYAHTPQATTLKIIYDDESASQMEFSSVRCGIRYAN